MVSIGIDIGGSHISSVAVDNKTGTIIRESRFQDSLNTSESAQKIIDSWCSTIRKTIHATGDKSLIGLGIAMPGPFDYQNGISMIGAENKIKPNRKHPG